MTANQKGGGQKKKGDNAGKKVPPVTNDETKDDIKDKKHAGHTYDKDKSTNTYPYPITINIKKTNPWKRQEVISIVGIGITGLLFFVAMGTFKNTKNQFKKANEPYLQLYDLSLKNFGVGLQYTFGYRIENIGSFPIKIVKRRFTTFIDTTEPLKIIFDTLPNFDSASIITGQYLSKSNTDTTYLHRRRRLEFDEYGAVMDGYAHIYLVAIIEYENFITNKVDTYRFAIKYSPGFKYYDFVYNENLRGK